MAKSSPLKLSDHGGKSKRLAVFAHCQSFLFLIFVRFGNYKRMFICISEKVLVNN